MTATVTENPLITALRDTRDAKQAELDKLLETPTAEKRNLSETETATFNEIREALAGFDERITELVELDKRKSEANEARRVTSVAVVNEPNPVYREHDNGGPSFFRDLAAHGLNRADLAGPNHGSIDEVRTRLSRSQETRAGDMTTVAGAGGEFAPPLWQVDRFAELARPGRVAADLCNKQDLPSGVSSINLPKVSTGSTAAVQATQNSALSDTAMTTTSVSSGITTIGGKQIVSMQLLQQSGIPFDRVILQDLARAYAVQVDTQVLYGSNANGQVKGWVGNASNTAFTTASPAPASVTNANSLYYTVAKAAAAMQTTIYQVPDAIVMHPNRWAWVLGAVDSNARPFVIPSGPQFNGLGNVGDPVAQGFAGTFGAYNVYTDPTISTTANSATNQDEIYIVRRDEQWLYESPVQAASFDATYADNASILFRVLGYMAFIGNRYAGATGSIRGTGLVAP